MNEGIVKFIRRWKKASLIINFKGGNKEEKRRSNVGFMNVRRGGGAVLLVTLGYTINTNYGNRQDKEAERASRQT